MRLTRTRKKNKGRGGAYSLPPYFRARWFVKRILLSISLRDMDMLARFVPRIPKGYTSLVLIHIPPGEISSRQARYFVYLREYGYALLLFFFDFSCYKGL
uniref:Unclassified n=2 Tax=Fusarium pseudograminearum TaxID=101028 RepID=W1I9C9_FUSPS|nr:unclassified [Fusarium pseudograminearum CS3427]CDL73270.1 unclassified [Fusarium pseudograminearum CS5834]CDX48208.1 unclassified [Fusarium pseudograminearum CS5834]CDX48396.1 unclassified [Fusarium pseudograminearum CS3427]